MYKLMKSERFVLEHIVGGSMVAYRHQEIRRFQKFLTAFVACEMANERTAVQHYILNGNGQEYYAGTWIA